MTALLSGSSSESSSISAGVRSPHGRLKKSDRGREEHELFRTSRRGMSSAADASAPPRPFKSRAAEKRDSVRHCQRTRVHVKEKKHKRTGMTRPQKHTRTAFSMHRTVTNERSEMPPVLQVWTTLHSIIPTASVNPQMSTGLIVQAQPLKQRISW